MDLLALPKPAYKPNGIEITNAQGQDTTKNVNALYNHSKKTASLKIIIGITARAIAKKTTVGVYILAKRVINCSIGVILNY